MWNPFFVDSQQMYDNNDNNDQFQKFPGKTFLRDFS